MLIACVQSDVTFANIAENRKRITEHIHAAGKMQAKLVVMPECMLCGYAYESREQAWEHAVSIEDDVFIDIANLAATYDLHVTFGFAAIMGPSNDFLKKAAINCLMPRPWSAPAVSLAATAKYICPLWESIASSIAAIFPTNRCRPGTHAWG